MNAPKLNLVSFSLSLHEVKDWESYLNWASVSDYSSDNRVVRGFPEEALREERIPREYLFSKAKGFELVLSRVRFHYYLVILKPKC